MVSWIPKFFWIGYQLRTDLICQMKLVGQGKQYWANIEKLMTLAGQEPVQTWDEMKLELKEKYLHVSYTHRLLDQWQRLTQGTQPVVEYITKFDEFLVRYGENKSDTVVLSIFCSELREALSVGSMCEISPL